MDAFLAFAARRFALSPAEARALTGGLLWLMQLHAGEDFAQLYALDPDVARLVDGAPAALAPARRALPFFPGQGRVCGTQASVLRLFSRHGFSLARAGRFARGMLAFLATEAGSAPVHAIVARTPVLLLLLSAEASPGPRPRPSRPLSAVA
ncbi:MAG: hypothetical protein R3F60_15680 [bacterium]